MELGVLFVWKGRARGERVDRGERGEGGCGYVVCLRGQFELAWFDGWDGLMGAYSCTVIDGLREVDINSLWNLKKILVALSFHLNFKTKFAAHILLLDQSLHEPLFHQGRQSTRTTGISKRCLERNVVRFVRGSWFVNNVKAPVLPWREGKGWVSREELFYIRFG